MTAISAFILASVFAAFIYYSKMYGVPVILVLIGLSIWKNHKKHTERAENKHQDKIINLKKIKDASTSIASTFEHMSY